MEAVDELCITLVQLWVGDDGHPRVWELDRGVKGPPGGADKDGGGTIRVAWFYSNSLSVAERLYFFSPHKQIFICFCR